MQKCIIIPLSSRTTCIGLRYTRPLRVEKISVALIMREDLKYPNFEAAKSVLSKKGVNTELRLNRNDQDFEYTSCLLSELSQYINLYSEP